MGLEIERKFLVKNLKFLDGVEGVRYSQGYIPTNGNPGLRVRIAGERAFITLKSDVSPDGVRHEFEYDVPIGDAEEMIDLFCRKPLIEKIRYKLRFKDLLWEIDVFEGDNEGLIIAEVELEDKDQKVELPEWVGEEVTAYPRYCNSRLATNPYCNWTNGTKAGRL